MKKIEYYSFGKIRTGGVDYTSDVVITPDKVIGNWWRKEGHSLHVDDLGGLLACKPETVIIGTGASGLVKIPESTSRHIRETGAELVALPTAEAVELINREWAGKRISAGLHLTC